MAEAGTILAIIGATASGKSTLAMEVARRSGAEILCVDSMQVYRGMDIGTAKATAAERAAVPHHLLDVAAPNETFTAARFVELADVVIGRGRRLVAVGGTPLYFKSLLEGLFEGPPADESLRTRLREVEGAELHRRLALVDPAAAGRIHANDQRRLIRALEVHELTGQPISTLQRQWDAGEPRHRVVWVGITWEREALNRRINARVKEMLGQGWLEETRALVERYGGLSATAGEATGYGALMAHLRGELAMDEAAEQIKIATRQLARRQMKWFRRFAGVAWLAGGMPLEAAATAAIGNWQQRP